MVGAVQIEPVDPSRLPDLDRLFDTSRATRRCWCTAFCTTTQQFALGWFGGGNQRRFRSMAASTSSPMGLLAYVDGVPVAWCACGPRSRYMAAISGRSKVLAGECRDEDDQVWLIACLYVDPEHRSDGLVPGLVSAAVTLAAERGARAVQAWPRARGSRDSALVHVGGEAIFLRLGFQRVQQFDDSRVLLRRDLTDLR